MSLYVELFGLLVVEPMEEGCFRDILKRNDEVGGNALNFNYDYIMTEILMNHLPSEEFLALRNKAKWGNRFKSII